MCDVAARCPACGQDLDGQQTYWSPETNLSRYECKCGAVTTVSVVFPGLVMTRQDAVVKP